MELIFVRHSITPGNLERRFIGSTDQPLAPVGVELAERVHGTVPAVEGLYVSPLQRCQQTAAILWPKMDITTVDNLREIHFGMFEGKCHQEMKDDPQYIAWVKDGGKNLHLNGGETQAACRKRVIQAFEFIVKDCKAKGLSKAAVVSHGGILMTLFSAIATPQRDYYDWLMKNCSIFHMETTEHPLGLQLLAEHHPT